MFSAGRGYDFFEAEWESLLALPLSYSSHHPTSSYLTTVDVASHICNASTPMIIFGYNLKLPTPKC